jgi:hypothetical protein
MWGRRSPSEKVYLDGYRKTIGWSGATGLCNGVTGPIWRNGVRRTKLRSCRTLLRSPISLTTTIACSC